MGLGRWPQNELSPLCPKHLVGIDGFDSDPNASVGNLDPLQRCAKHFMRHHYIVVCVGLGHEVVVGNLQKRRDPSRFVALTVCPIAHNGQAGDHFGVRAQKKPRPLPGPFGKFVVNRLDFITYSLDAEDPARSSLPIKPVPECGAELESVVEVLRLDEDVGVEQVRRHTTPSLSQSSLNVAFFLKPSILNASA